MKKVGFTMIELIFVIVIIGILAAIAIPKLSATRTDAEAAAIVQETQSAIEEIIGDVTAKGGNLRDKKLIEHSYILKKLVEEGKAENRSNGLLVSIYGSDNKYCINFYEYNNTTLKVYFFPTKNDSYVIGPGNSHSPDCLKARKILGKAFESTAGNDKNGEVYYNVSGRSVNF